MSQTYMRVFEKAKVHRAQDGHLKANIQNIKAVEMIDKRVRAELAAGH